jgi:hypothetical protein
LQLDGEAPALEQRRILVGRELEGARELALGTVDVEREASRAGHGQVAHGAGL